MAPTAGMSGGRRFFICHGIGAGVSLAKYVMNLIRLFPVFFSTLLIAAHFQRGGLTVVALFCLVIPGVLLVTKSWSVKVVQVFLLFSAVEWVRTLFSLVQLRMEYGMPWLRLALILGGVALFTLTSTLVFNHAQLRKKYFQN